MKVIGAGFGRTGTRTLKSALELLGFGPCYHMVEVFQHPEHVPVWAARARGEAVDWRGFFQGWEATVDWPGCTYYKELMTTFPDAKVLLSVRDNERWHKSCMDTIYKISTIFPLRLIAPLVPRMGSTSAMITAQVWQGTFGGRFADRAHAIAVHEAHVAEVKATVPAEKLLVFDVKQGWEPLCAFLGVPVPAVPFPRENDSAEFGRRIRLLNAMAWGVVSVPVLAVLGVVLGVVLG